MSMYWNKLQTASGPAFLQAALGMRLVASIHRGWPPGQLPPPHRIDGGECDEMSSLHFPTVTFDTKVAVNGDSGHVFS